MNALISQLNEPAGPWVEAMLRACWQGGLAIFTVWLICRIFQRMSGRVRSWLWRLAYLKLLTVFIWMTPIELSWLPAKPGVQASPMVSKTDLATVAPTATIKESEVSPVIAAVGLHGSAWLMIIWAGGVLWSLARLFREWLAATRLRRGCRDVEEDGMRAILVEVREQLGLRRIPALLQSCEVKRPMLIGIARPAIILPELTQFSPTDLRLILAHELAHIRRLDLLWSWLPVVAQTLFFFHPLVWLARREWEAAQEVACDEMGVLAVDASAAEFGDMLLKISTLESGRHPDGLLAAGVVHSKKTLKRRLIAMKHIKPVSGWRIFAATSTVVVLLLVGIIPWRLVAAESQKTVKSASTPARQVGTGARTSGFGTGSGNDVGVDAGSFGGLNAAAQSPATLGSSEPPAGAQAPRTKLNVSAPTGGLVTKMFVRNGAQVKKGKLLVQLDDRKARAKMETAKARYHSGRTAYELKKIETELGMLQAEKALKMAEKGLTSKSEAVAQLKIAEVQLEKARADMSVIESQFREAHIDLDMLAIRAPEDGVVARINIELGEYVKFPPDEPMMILFIQSPVENSGAGRKTQDPSAARAR